MPEPGLVLTTESSDNSDAASPPDRTTAKNLHHYLFSPWRTGLSKTLIKATHDVVSGDRDHAESLRDTGVTARYGMYATTVSSGWCHPRYVDILYSSTKSLTDLQERHSPFWAAIRTTWELPNGTLIMGASPRGTLEDVYNGPFAIFRASTVTPHLDIHVDGSLWEHRRSTRERFVKYLVQMARGCRINVVGTSYWVDRLRRDHYDQLVSAVSEIRDPPQNEGHYMGDRMWEQVSKTLIDFPPSNSVWTLLKLLNMRESGLYSYKELHKHPDVPGGNSRTRQLIANLCDYGLAERVTVAAEPHLARLPPGETAYQRYKKEYGEQSNLEGFAHV